MDREALVLELSGKLSGKGYRRHGDGHKGGDGHGFVLFYLMGHGGKALPGEICQAMEVTTPRVAAILRGLEEKGLITRAVVEQDRRKVCVTLTEKGTARAEQKQKRLEQFLRDLIDRLSEEDASALPRILDAIDAVRSQQQETDERCGDRHFPRRRRAE